MNAVLDKPLNRAPKPHVAFDVYRVPFFLEPDYPTGEEFEESNRDRLVKKWGGQTQWEAQKRNHRLKERGLEAGIEKFNLDRKASNTVASHVLVQWAATVYGLEKSEAVYDILNRVHFVEGRKLNDRALLVAVAYEAGLDGDAAELYLSSGKGADDVRRVYNRVQQMGVHSIPTFVIDGGRFVMSGAAHASELEATLRKIEREVVVEGKLERPPPVFGPILRQIS